MFLNEATLLNNLRLRYMKNAIYVRFLHKHVIYYMMSHISILLVIDESCTCCCLQKLYVSGLTQLHELLPIATVYKIVKCVGLN